VKYSRFFNYILNFDASFFFIYNKQKIKLQAIVAANKTYHSQV